MIKLIISYILILEKYYIIFYLMSIFIDLENNNNILFNFLFKKCLTSPFNNNKIINYTFLKIIIFFILQDTIYYIINIFYYKISCFGIHFLFNKKTLDKR